MNAVLIGLIAFGVILVVLEIFLPGGICGVLGAVFLVAGIIIGFTRSPELGFSLMIGSVVFSMIVLWAGLKFVPNSRIGKKLFLDQTAKEWQGFEARSSNLLGKTGVAATQLHPCGVAMVEDERVDVVTEGEIIEKDASIRIIEVEGNRIVVARNEPADEATTA